MGRLQKTEALAAEEAGRISRSPRDWMGYLDMAARLYRYPFSDAMLIHAQRPDAAACASMEDWNGKVNRWVKRGSKGIALIDDSGPKRSLKYVFDLADTRLVQGGWTPVLWKMEGRHEAAVLSYLSETYETGGKEAAGLNPALMEIASRTAEENLKEAMQGLEYEVEGTFLEGLGEDAVRVSFRELLKNSIFYALSARCGLDPMEYLEEEDFAGIADYNTLPVLAVLGNAASSLTEPVLRGIGRTVRETCLKEELKALENRTGTGYNKFSTLKRENVDEKGETADGTDIPPGRGLPDSGPDHRGGAGTHREIRDAAEDIPEREQEGLVPGNDAFRETGPASGAGGESGRGEDGNHDGGASGEIPGAGQGEGSAGVDGAHERAAGDGRGERLTGTGLQLNREKKDQEAERAGEEKAPAFSGSTDSPEGRIGANQGRFPSVERQIREIEERVQALYAGEISIPANVVDEALRMGGDQRGSRQRIIYNYMIPQTEKEYAEALRREYGTGGRGIVAGGVKYSVWHDETGMQIAEGDTVKGAALHKAFLSWENVSGRVHQLLKQGEYAPQEALDGAFPNALSELAGMLAGLKRNMADGVPETVFGDVSIFTGSVPETEANLRALLVQPEYLTELKERIAGFAEAYRNEESLMRNHLSSPGRVMACLEKFSRETVSYQAREGFAWDEPPAFITQDEMDGFLAKGTGYKDSRLEIYSYFLTDRTAKEKEIFLKEKYGGNGGGHLSGSVFAWHDGKGILLTRDMGDGTEAERLLKWPAAAKRVEYLIGHDRYLTAEDFAHMPEYEKEYMAKKAISFYSNIPEEIMRPWAGKPYTDEGLNDVIRLFGNPEGKEALINHMGQALASLSEDFEGYGEKARIFADVREYAEGTYTLFPQKKQSIQEEMQIRDSVQLSLFDFMDMNTAPAEKKELTPKPSAKGMEKEEIKSREPERMGITAGSISFPEAPPETAKENPLPDKEQHQESAQNRDFNINITEERNAEAGSPEKEDAGTRKNLPAPINFRITDDNLGEGGPKQKFRANMDAVILLKKLEAEGRPALPGEQETLSRYAGWGSLPMAFEEGNSAWAAEYAELKDTLTEEEYRQARASTLNAFYTPPVVIKAMYEALGNMGLTGGNVLEPACGTGNFMGLVPEGMSNIKMYGVEVDSLSGRIAGQLYQKNHISIQGFENAQYPSDFFDCVIGNVPFGAYQVPDRKYDRFHFLVHDYFIAKSLDLVRPGGVVAVITSSGTMDKATPAVREYIAHRADLLGAVRLPEDAFRRNAGTDVVADILFFQKRDRAVLEMPEWIHLAETAEGYAVNSYFASHPEMVLGKFAMESSQFGKQALTVKPMDGAVFSEQLREAVSHIKGNISDREPDVILPEGEKASLPADPSVRNFSFAEVDGKVYYRENSRMNPVELPAKTGERVLGMVRLRNTTQELIRCQMEGGSDTEVEALQEKLGKQYDSFTKKYGLINSTANRRAFSQDSSYCLLAALELVDEDGNFERKADIFTKRTIRRAEAVTSVDTASEALAVSIGEKAGVDVPFMAALSGKTEEEVIKELTGVIFKNPETGRWEAADEYLSGNVREKLRTAKAYAEKDPAYAPNVKGLEKVQPKDLDASEIEVRLGAAWVKDTYITEFMGELLKTPEKYLGDRIAVKYSKAAGSWNISGKKLDARGNSLASSTYGTDRASAYRLLEDALNLRDTKIYDTVREDGKEKRVLNKKATMVAQQKQEMIREAFKEWVFRDMDRREDLCRTYNEIFNSIRPREYDGSHIQFAGMNPEITLMPHQKNAAAHILYGGNTLLAHCVGAGKTFEMAVAGMESRWLGLSSKSLYVVPNHLTEQWGSDFLRLYPGANILVATKKDFEPANRKKFCSRIATGDYDGIIIGHSQFEKIPLSIERQKAAIEEQINEIMLAVADAKASEGERYTVKQMEKTKKSLEAKLEKLNNQERKDDVVTFEELGVDRLFVDESHAYKNLFLYTKMRNVAGVSQTDAQKSTDMYMKCRYMDEITGGRGITFATGTPISNSMVELYTIMRYLQYDRLQELGLGHFDAWAADFGETVTSIELSPEGTGYRAKTRFARFYNLPELMALFKECADIQTADLLDLPVPEAEYVNEVLKPSREQQKMVEAFAERAEAVRAGGVDPSVDNMLKITNDGRKCALDQRLLNDMLPDAEGSKAGRCVENAFHIWESTMGEKSTQIIFCDLSTPKAGEMFNVYDDVREKLAAMGIPKEEIAFIHEAATEAKKAELFAKVRAGQVRILLGSTPKLGAGTNVQDRLAALHHLDCPWKPSELEQQEGRILRQGNRNKKVKIFRYVTESTFDSYMWQILENKQKFISQIMTSRSPVRSCEDVDDAALSYAEIKALATGNVHIKEKMELDIQVGKLKLLKADYTSQKYRMEADIARNYPAQIAALKERIAGLSMDKELAAPVFEKQGDKDSFSMEIMGKIYTERKEAGEALTGVVSSSAEAGVEIRLGHFYGFALTVSFDYFSSKYMLDIKGECSRRIELGKDALGNMQRISNALAKIPEELQETRRKLESVQRQLAIAEEEVGKPFPKEAELAGKLERLAELNAMLNMDEKNPAETAGLDEGEKEEDSGVPEEERQEEKQEEKRGLPLLSDSTQPETALNGRSRAEVEETVLCYAQAELEDAGLEGDAEILAVRVYGSRTREGLYREDSDIDVAISYSGLMREDSFFNLLNEENMTIVGIPVDMNPISLAKTGTLEEYLEGAERYLDHKEAQMKAERTAETTDNRKPAPERNACGTGERRSVLADLKERKERIAERGAVPERQEGHKRREMGL
ncbi:MAG: hypothetical protein NC389_10735 [Acetatifactor muris]|nr:hypothetical protein [Acetatifactor muris]